MRIAAAFPRPRLRRIIAACAICLTASSAVVEAQEAGGRILGSVQDLTGLPVSGASITVRGPVERNLPAGEDGRFVIEWLPDGKYTITAILEGFAPSSRTTIEIVNGATAAVDLFLVSAILEQVARHRRSDRRTAGTENTDGGHSPLGSGADAARGTHDRRSGRAGTGRHSFAECGLLPACHSRDREHCGIRRVRAEFGHLHRQHLHRATRRRPDRLHQSRSVSRFCVAPREPCTDTTQSEAR